MMSGLDISAPMIGSGASGGGDGGLPNFAWPIGESTRSRRVAQMIPLLLAGSDIVAFVISVSIGVAIADVIHVLLTSAHDRQATVAHIGPALGDALPIGICVLTYFILTGAYRTRRPFWSEFGRLIAVSAYALLAAGFYAFILKLDGLRIALAAPWILFPFVAELGRQTCRRILHRRGLWQIPTLFVGEAHDEGIARDAIESEALPSYRIVDRQSPRDVLRFIGDRADLGAYGAFELLLCIDPACPTGIELVECLTRRRIPFVLIPRIADLPAHSLSHSSYFSHDTIVLSYRSNLEQPMLRVLKRAFDMVAAAIILALASPVFVLLYVLIALDGGQPIYGHRRVGLGGREFSCLKFRSMARNGDEILARILASDPAAREEWHRTQKLRCDPRITRVGHFIRKTSLDEIPQLLNVLRGDMSLVGPRPIVEAEIRHYGRDIEHYYGTRPGITGLWQVSGRSDTGYGRRVELDRWYVRNWTLWHDIAILAKTVPAVLRQRGAR